MRAEPAAVGRGTLLAAALARAEAWLLEPAPERAVTRPVELPPRPVVAVVGLGPRCGATTLARALGARLAGRDPGRAAIVAGAGEAPGFAPAGRAAAKLAARFRSGGVPARPAGRLCLLAAWDYAALSSSARGLAPLVLDVRRNGSAGVAASVADLTLIVAPASGEPALAELATRALGRAGREPLTVVARGADRSRWEGRASIRLPDSRTGARLASAGWEPRGALGAAVASIGALCEEAACA
jgi:hypothetical protein